MNKYLLLFTVLMLSYHVVAQNIPPAAKPLLVGHTQKDTVREKDTTKENQEPQYFYLSLNTNIFVNSRGGFEQRFSPAAEFGRTFGIFDIGLATGRLSSMDHGPDTSRFIEFRPTINVFSKGRFAEALCLGGGFVFKAKQGMMTEICNSINFNVTEVFAIAVQQGYLFFDGTNDHRNEQYMGFTFTYNFLRKHSVNMRRKRKAIVSDN
jgi:hypothetical protein